MIAHAERVRLLLENAETDMHDLGFERHRCGLYVRAFVTKDGKTLRVPGRCRKCESDARSRRGSRRSRYAVSAEIRRIVRTASKAKRADRVFEPPASAGARLFDRLKNLFRGGDR